MSVISGASPEKTSSHCHRLSSIPTLHYTTLTAMETARLSGRFGGCVGCVCSPFLRLSVSASGVCGCACVREEERSRAKQTKPKCRRALPLSLSPLAISLPPPISERSRGVWHRISFLVSSPFSLPSWCSRLCAFTAPLFPYMCTKDLGAPASWSDAPRALAASST